MSAAVLNPVWRLIVGSSRGEAVSVDFKRALVTFKVGSEALLRGGNYFLVAQDLVQGIQQEADAFVALPYSTEAANVSVYGDGFSVERGECEWDCWRVRQSEPYRERVRPGQWYGSETRKDARGVSWHRSLPVMVMDDFGDLVPVDGGVL